MKRKDGYRRKINLPVLITLWSIGITLCLAGAAMMFFGICPTPVRVTFGILGIFLIATSSPFARTISY